MTDLIDPPEVLVDCEACNGEGSIDVPRPFADDPYFCMVQGCDACAGVGFFVREAEGDRPIWTEDDCPGHVASDRDPKVCGRCGVHIDSLRPPDDYPGD